MLEGEADVPAGQEVVLVRLVVEHGPHEVLLRCGEAWQDILKIGQERERWERRREESIWYVSHASCLFFVPVICTEKKFEHLYWS